MNTFITQALRFLPDSLYIKLKYKRTLGYYPNLKNPKTYSEKINWLKINEREPIQTLCADKFLVRNFIKETIGEEYLIPLLYQTYDVNDLIPENLPDIPFIIKTNHDSQKPIIVYDKNIHDWEETRQILGAKLNTNYYFEDREWHYKNIRPCIIVEKLMTDCDGNIPCDYKVYRINGKTNFILVDKDRFKSEHSRYFFDSNWIPTEFRIGNQYIPSKNNDVEKPIHLNKIIELSESILEQFCFLRLDWYQVDGKIYFGEITFHPGGGFSEIYPSEWDKKIADSIILPKA